MTANDSAASHHDGPIPADRAIGDRALGDQGVDDGGPGGRADDDIAGLDIDFEDVEPGISAKEQAGGSRRLIQIGLGVLLVVVGIPMIPLAGPGWAVVLVGLNLIKPDNALVRWLRRKLPVVPEEGPIPKRYYVMGGVLLVISSILSWRYGGDVLTWARDTVGL